MFSVGNYLISDLSGHKTQLKSINNNTLLDRFRALKYYTNRSYIADNYNNYLTIYTYLKIITLRHFG